MPRKGWRKTWIKLYSVDCLEGSIRYQLKPDERGVWYDLLNFAAVCANGGTISDKDNRPFPHSFIASRLNISLRLLERTLEKCKEEGRIKEDDNGMHIVNWKAYQSEYERQKPYRQKRGTLTEYTYDLYCKDDDEFWDWRKRYYNENRYDEADEEDRDDRSLQLMYATLHFFRAKYGRSKGAEYWMRVNPLHWFIGNNRDALRREGLIWQDEESGKELVDERLFQIILDSFSPPKTGDPFAISSFAKSDKACDTLDYDKVINAVRPILKEEDDTED